ncbi:MAG: FHA domain-containing protein [Solirubrobacteraceae bacterium]|nr:FHA domain-containing protein [Solirubrobacteraceae bacterium]
MREDDAVVEPASVALKFAFLAILYLFLIWVARSALKDLRRETVGGGAVARPASPPPDATGLHSAARAVGEGGGAPRLVVDTVPGHQSGAAYDLVGDCTMGRGDVEIHFEDPFASGRHAQLTRQGSVIVLEDLGSTNGTYLNEEPVQGPQPLHPGDRIRIGDSVFIFQDH